MSAKVCHVIVFLGGTGVERVRGHVVMVGGCLVYRYPCGWFLLWFLCVVSSLLILVATFSYKKND